MKSLRLIATVAKNSISFLSHNCLLWVSAEIFQKEPANRNADSHWGMVLDVSISRFFLENLCTNPKEAVMR